MGLLDCPPEILEHIISHSPEPHGLSVYQSFSLICRSMRDIGQKRIFRTISLQMNAPPLPKTTTSNHAGKFNSDGRTKLPIPLSFLRLHKVLKANPTLASYISALWIHNHMQGTTDPFWMTDTDSEAAVAPWVDILTAISSYSPAITSFEMMTTRAPIFWSRINRDIQSTILKIWCKPTMKRVYINGVHDLPRNLFGMGVERLFLCNSALNEGACDKEGECEVGGTRATIGAYPDQEVALANASHGIVDLMVELGSQKQVKSFLSAIEIPSNAAGLRGTRSLVLRLRLAADLPEVVSIALLPRLPSLKHLSLRWWSSSLWTAGTDHWSHAGRLCPLNLALLPDLESISIVFPSNSCRNPAPANFLIGTFRSLLLQPTPASTSIGNSSQLPPVAAANKLQSISIFWTPHIGVHPLFMEVSKSLEVVHRQSKGTLQDIRFYLDDMSVTDETKEAWKNRFNKALEWGVQPGAAAVKIFC